MPGECKRSDWIRRWGAAGITFGLPIACYAAAFVCNDVTGCPAPTLLHPFSFSFSGLISDTRWPGFGGLMNTKATLAVLAYYAFNLILYAVLPGKQVEGTKLRTGKKLKYKFNGNIKSGHYQLHGLTLGVAFETAVVTLGLAALGSLFSGAEFSLWTFIWDNYVPLLSASIVISYALAIFTYVRSFQVKAGDKQSRELAAGGHTGNLIYDFYIGRELNPPVDIPFIGKIDIKSYMELRPGMLGWLVLNFAFMARQYHSYGYITDSMLITVFSQVVYVIDALWNESAILTTMDITTDGFGFMLAFGDLVWVPFTYSLQARYLAVHPVQLGVWGCLGVFAVQGLGYYIFRASNNEKNKFRTNPEDPSVKHLEYIETKAGSRLLVSGWWGTSRHINYLGDWIMSWAYCLPTGLAGYVVKPSITGFFTGRPHVVPGEARGWGTLITYFYMAYFAVLLIHRAARDDEKCRRKYGKDWEEYCRRVPWKIIPYVY